MIDKIGEHQRELDDAERKLEEIDSKLRAITDERAELVEVVKGWKAIVARDRRQNPDSAADKPGDALVDKPPAKVDNNPDDEEGTNKTQFLRDQIRLRGTAGATPKDLRRAAKTAGIAYSETWPYNSLNRLKRKGQVVNKEGKYYMAGEN